MTDHPPNGVETETGKAVSRPAGPDPGSRAARAGSNGSSSNPRGLDEAMEVIAELSASIGPRRPCSRAELATADFLVSRLNRRGLTADRQFFRGYTSFGWPFGLITGLGVLAGLLPRRMRTARSAAGIAAAAGLVVEGDLRSAALSRLLSRKPSRNVVAVIEPEGETRRELVLSCHMDTSRSGLMFQPGVVEHLRTWTVAQSLATLIGGLEPLADRSRTLRRLIAACRGLLAIGLVMLAEREIRGQDVPGASDNASGAGVVAALGGDLADSPLEHTRVVLLFTGCEEAGTLGAQAFIRSGMVGDGAIYLNFDNVGGPGTVRYLRREGIIARWDADEGLIRAADQVAERHPDLGFTPEDDPAGLTYDSSPVLARGGRAMTISVQDGSIPNLHLPSDTIENLDPDAVRRTYEVGRAMLSAIDEGAAD